MTDVWWSALISIMKFNCAHTEVVEITFKNGIKFLFDYDALSTLSKYKFYPVKKHKQWYLYANKGKTTTTFHKEYMKPPKGLEIDHINGDARDNRRNNLRIVSHLVNQNNFVKKTARGKSKYRYVNWCSARNIWRVQISYNKKTKTIGFFTDDKVAAIAANNYILKNKLPKVLNEV